MKTVVVVITPEKAQKMLEKNTSNRPVSPSNLKFLCQQLRNDKWMLNGESVKLSKTSKILDGQHRLMACVKENKSFETLLTTGINEESMHTMDTGKNRSASDVLSLTYGGKYNALTSSIIRFVIYFNYGKYSINSGAKNLDIADNTDILRFVELHPDIFDFASMINSFFYKSDKVLTKQLVGGIWWILSKQKGAPKEVISKFFNQILFGDNLDRDSPVFLFRKRLIEIKMKTAVYKPTMKQLIWTTFKVWNYYNSGKKVNRLRLTDDVVDIY